MTLLQLLLFAFVSMWVIGDVAGADYYEKLYWSLAITIGFAHLNNVHGVICKKIKSFFANKKAVKSAET